MDKIKIFYKVIFTTVLTLFSIQNIHAQSALIPVNASHTQGEWETLQPLKLGNLDLFGIKLNPNGTMIAKVAIDGKQINFSFNYKIDLSNFTMQANEVIGEITPGTSFTFLFRKRFDGGIELEEQSAMPIISQSGNLTSQVKNAAVFSKTNSVNNSPSIIDELAAMEKNLQKRNIYSGTGITSNQALNSAKNRATGESNTCPKGYKERNPEDIRSYMVKQEAIQLEISKTIEKFTNKELNRGDAINNFNTLVSQSNELTQWGWGKVTNGTCGPVEITRLISKSVQITNNLFKDFRSMLDKE